MNAPQRCAASAALGDFTADLIAIALPVSALQITHLLPLLRFVPPFAIVLSRANNAAEVSAATEMGAI
jgi:hypothetical protein